VTAAPSPLEVCHGRLAREWKMGGTARLTASEEGRNLTCERAIIIRSVSEEIEAEPRGQGVPRREPAGAWEQGKLGDQILTRSVRASARDLSLADAAGCDYRLH